MSTFDSLHKASVAFHRGEKLIQQKLGIANIVAERTKGFIRPWMPAQHRAFFESGPFTLLGLLDHTGHPVAVPIWSHDEMIQSPSPTRLQFSLATANMTLLYRHLHLDIHTGSKIGIVGVELSTRRRNRVNGTILHVANNKLDVAVDQSFGNCPKYIHKRITSIQKTDNGLPSGKVARSDQLTTEAKITISRANTFYIASRHSHMGTDSRQGIDVSHRGGQPGFVRIQGKTLLIPDYSGNNFFNTLGNITLDPRVGLCFIDDNSGTLLFIQGAATIEWDAQAIPENPQAERLIAVEIQQITYVQGYFPLRFEVTEISPHV